MTDRRDRVGLLVMGLLVSSGALFIDAGPLGVVVALIGVTVSYLTRGVYGVALHHLGIVALTGVPEIFVIGPELVGITLSSRLDVIGLVGSPSVIGIVLLETAAVCLLVADAPEGHRLEMGALSIPTTIILAVGIARLAETRDFVIAATALVCVVAAGSYLIHRYSRVRLGLAASEMESGT